MRFWRRHPAEEQRPEDGDEAVALTAPQSAEDLEPTPEEVAEVHAQTERALERTRRGFFGRLGGLFERADFDDDLWDELEEILVGADTGLATAEQILADLRKRVKDEGVKQSARVREILREELVALLEASAPRPPAWARADTPPLLIILVVGVNGAGKTTTIAKLAHGFRSDGATVLRAAADTFRAAAVDQLKVWGERAGVRVVAHRPGADPGAVVFDTLSAAENGRADFVIVDTAGRLHTKTNLMEELRKINRVIQRNHPEAPHETLLVLDATTGQNGLAQARTFTDAVGVSGIVLAKLDGTAKGGIAFAIAHDLRIPVRFIGTGERLEDLAPFDPHDFVDALLDWS
ncbi:MAG: signal recognition particle-docking protein FtsY [Dehalococcoidia bacterium]|nr:signal recognition particle-docking protein FtsY [Dehalococcoidia bacterium]